MRNYFEQTAMRMAGAQNTSQNRTRAQPSMAPFWRHACYVLLECFDPPNPLLNKNAPFFWGRLTVEEFL
jgi:hypothetical protein